MNNNVLQDAVGMLTDGSILTAFSSNWVAPHEARRSDRFSSNFWTLDSVMSHEWRGSSAKKEALTVEPSYRLLPESHSSREQASELIGDPDLSELYEHYVIREASIKDFLKNRRSLPTLLVGIASALRFSFGDEQIITLEVVNAGDDIPTMRVAVAWSGSIESAELALQTFDEEFWLDNCSRASGNIVVTYELT